MNEKFCKHLELYRLPEEAVANEIHKGREKAYYCPRCGRIFFVPLGPAELL